MTGSATGVFAKGRVHVFIIAAAALAAVLLPFAGVPQTYIQLLIIVGINTLLGLSITMLLGFTGEISLGNAGFFAIGAYVSALSVLKLGLPAYLGITLAVAACGLAGLLLSFPANRVREFYLAILTFGFGMIIQVIVKQWKFTGGFMGLSGIPSPTLNNFYLFGLKVDLTGYYHLTLAALLATFWLLNNLLKSYVGRSLISVSRSEIAAASLGIKPGGVRQLAYAVSGCLAGLGGALYAHLIGFLGSEAFGLMASVMMLVTALLGGLNALAGALFGSVVLTILTHKLQVFHEWELFFFGLLLLLVSVLFPGGITSLFKMRTSFIRNMPVKDVNLRSEEGTAFSKACNSGEVPEERNILGVEDVTKRFGGVTALNGVSLKIARGSVHGLIGPNGSGKSTLINVISGVYKPDGGQVVFEGGEVGGLPAYTLSRKGIVRTFQNLQVFTGLTVLENVAAGAFKLYRQGMLSCMLNTPLARKEEAMVLSQSGFLLEKLGLDGMGREIANKLPYGIQRLVEVARAANSRPKLILFDEPAAGLSEAELKRLGSIIRLLNNEGVTVVIIDHHINFLMELADHVTVLDCGEVIYDGSPAGCMKDPRVIEAYLGGQCYAEAQ